MDVAAFVGFAPRGPVDVPVPIEDVVRFDDIFGGEIELAWDEGAGRPVTGHLASAVRSFFRNGGRKCYVVRVASPTAHTGRFYLPGLVEADRSSWASSGEGGDRGSVFYPSLVAARSEGAWSDGLSVGTTLRRSPVAVQEFSQSSGVIVAAPIGADAGPIVAGDLLRFTFGGHDLLLYYAVKATRPPDGAPPEARYPVEALHSTRHMGGGAPVALQGDEYWFIHVRRAPVPAESPPESDASQHAVHVKIAPMAPKIADSTAAQTETPLYDGVWFPPPKPGDPHRLILPAAAGLGPGSLLRVELEGEERRVLMAGVAEVRPAERRELQELEPIAPGPWDTVVTLQLLEPLTAAEGRGRLAAAASPVTKGDRLTFDLRVQDGERIVRLTGLGMTPQHPRYVGYLPSDRLLYGMKEDNAPVGDGPAPGAPLRSDVAHPRFPVATWFASDEVPPNTPLSDNPTPEDPASTVPGSVAPGSLEPEAMSSGTVAARREKPDSVFLPIGMQSEVCREGTAGRIVQSPFGFASGAEMPAAVRNGLSRFDGDLFLDPDLSDLTADTVVDAAFHKRYVLGRRLQRVHSTLGLDDVTLLAAPDAVHAPWKEGESAIPDFLRPPILGLSEGPEPRDGVAVTWSPIAGATRYLLQESPDPLFGSAARERRVDEPRFRLRAERQCPQEGFVRVRAERDGIPGPWSNTGRFTLPARRFVACDPDVVVAPELTDPVVHTEGLTELSWSALVPAPPDSAVITFTVEESKDPTFGDAQVVYRGQERRVALFAAGADSLYFRVRAAVDGRVGPWSNTVVFFPAAAGAAGTAPGRFLPSRVGPADERGAAEAGLLRIHWALLQLCRGSGDRTCLLTLPKEYEEERAAGYVLRLAASITPRAPDTLSYGALYHPWLRIVDQNGTSRLVPPDGAAAGVIAERSRTRGAWVAPANVLLRDVVAVDPELQEDGAVDLYNRGVNLVVRDPAGFTVWGAHTLSDDNSLYPLSVRRLLILLRKIAAREGAAAVFDMNDAALRRRLRRRFESILTDLFVRGAFAGKVPEEAFQVVTESGRTAVSSAERGRVVVELKIAPSYPLEFLSVRLVRLEGEGTRVTGR